MDDATLRARIEDAGINASAAPQQRWLDGWIVRYCPGKAKRARCVNAVAVGRLALDDKLRLATGVLAAAGLPVLVRITPFTQPPDLGAHLQSRGFALLDDSRVMVCRPLQHALVSPLPAGLEWVPLSAAAMAAAVGTLRGSPQPQQDAHAARLAASPVPCFAVAMRRVDDGTVLACGQVAIEAELAGLYDIVTRATERRQGLARALCERLLALAASQSATVAYLQVESDNAPARRIYQRLGFADSYAYHYRQAPGPT